MAGKDRPTTAAGDGVDAPKNDIAAGAEAAEGAHHAGMDHKRSGIGNRPTDRAFREAADREAAERSAADLLRERAWVHESGYGGKNGEPRTSSDQREDAEQGSTVPLEVAPTHQGRKK